MAKITRFPKGFDVTVCKKEDILATIDKNIIDKDVALAIIEQLEIDASNFIKEGRWTGIPFLGSIRKNPFKERIQSEEYQDLLDTASKELDKQKYVLFRKQVSAEINDQLKYERFFNYSVSKFANTNKEFYRRARKIYGEYGAKFLCWSLISMEFYNQAELFKW